MTINNIAHFASTRVTGEVQALGAMLGPVEFKLSDGRLISPLAVAPWCDDSGPEHDALPGVLKRLRGDWPCVPFGMTTVPDGLPSDWRPLSGHVSDHIDHAPHGYCSNGLWDLQQMGSSGVKAEIVYPQEHAIERLERTVIANAEDAAVDIGLTVHARRDTRLPIGFHPTFRLPDRAGAARLEFGGSKVKAWTYPIPAEPGRSLIAANQRNVRLDQILGVNGLPVSIQQLPFDSPSEDIVLLTGTEGRVDLCNNDEGYRVSLTWDSRALPSCLLWLSNFGRQFYPWCGRFRAIGIEPVAAAFDLRLNYKNDRNPLNALGIPTDVAFKASEPWDTSYSISCAQL